MKMLPGFQRKRHQRGMLAASGLLLLLATETIAQSGRRPPRPAQPPVTTPKTDSDTAPKNEARQLKQRVSLLVGKQISSKHLLSEDSIFGNFLKRLSEFKNVSIESLEEIRSDAAVKRAKSEAESIVVLLEFDVDEFQSGTIILNPQDLDIRVSIFEPRTGQKKFEGKVYYKAVGGPMLKRDNWPNGTPIRITTEAVGIEAAEQVRDWLVVEELRPNKEAQNKNH